ncbi:alpha/beta hydrolase [Paenibacillus woosongensis]|uniref:Esterase family protein n=1 Tax=Paenibacillus woosongensis TaxID=307580 RepID=A0A7X2Z1C5_9BACL|nr:alpha/beta hydrolase family protein [Paenibacillus woosongensis]MUG45665.1 esterase family protein [Paenibacillus woosongensis]
MALIQCRFFSEVLGLSTSMTVILPQPAKAQIGLGGSEVSGPFPALYLLHGLSDDDSIWLRRTSIERYVAELGLAVIMPQVDVSFYTDMAAGKRYWTFISEELPYICRSFFPLSQRREDTFVAGLSMGGYGAFKLALRKPDTFSAAASLSGALDVSVNRIDEVRRPIENNNQSLYEQVFGPAGPKGTENDLLYLLKTVDPASAPRLYQCCGTEDFLYEQNIRFRDACRNAGFDLTYEEGPGNHDWAYWDARIQDVLAWLPLNRA